MDRGELSTFAQGLLGSVNCTEFDFPECSDLVSLADDVAALGTLLLSIIGEDVNSDGHFDTGLLGIVSCTELNGQ